MGIFTEYKEHSVLELIEEGENDRRKVQVGRNFCRVYLAMANSMDLVRSVQRAS